MSEKNEKSIELFEDKIELGRDGKIIYHPLESLYYYYKEPGREPANQNYLTFAGDHLTEVDYLREVRVFYLEFHGEPEPEVYREDWADPVRAEILKRLSDEDRSWYISFVGDVTERLLLQDERRVPDELFRYMAELYPNKTITLTSPKPYGFGYGLMKRIFFEIPNQDIEWVINNVWPEAWGGYSIEGYNFPSRGIHLLKQWRDRPRDALLFRDVIEMTYMIFYTYPSEHRHFAFLTNKISFSDFERIINLEDLQRIIS